MSSELRRAQWREAKRRHRLRRRGEIEPFRPLAHDLSAGAVWVDDCLEWIRAHLPRGYGLVRWGGYVEVASRASLELKLGRPLRPGMMACHTCDNPPCIRQEHLFEGTAKQNTDDMVDKGRAAWLDGVRSTRPLQPNQWARP